MNLAHIFASRTHATRPAPPGLLIALVAAALTVLAGSALAQNWNEAGDAGNMVFGAQQTSGAGALTTINGNLHSAGDVDMFCIRVTDPANFRAYLNCVIHQENHLFLFNGASMGLTHNDGCAAGQSSIGAPLVPTIGTYYLAVGGWGALAINGPSNQLWTFSAGNPIVGQRAPDGPGAGLPLNLWAGGNLSVIGTNYTVHLVGAAFCNATTPVGARTWGNIRSIYR
ncbi:MAG: hypothetical protein HZB25_11595 [Candidatus Eisenbacteria bacterium]|nr:hypothetical protein [Candidatus Eisenbacteria bacterium]